MTTPSSSSCARPDIAQCVAVRCMREGMRKKEVWVLGLMHSLGAGFVQPGSVDNRQMRGNGCH
jgi:hypothetical protein